MTIAVVGATGNTGRAVVKELKALGQDPIAVVRNADKAREVLGAGVKTAIAELSDPAALQKALTGVESVFVVTGHNPGMVEQQNNVLDAALKAGAKYLVRVGGGRAVALADSPSVVGRGHAAIEERLKGSGIKWTILRPGLFMQNLVGQAASIKDAGKMVGAAAKELKIAFIDVRDTGAVGARILLDPEPHAGKTYEFSGKLISYGEIADAFSRCWAKRSNYVPVTLEQTEQALKSRDMPDWLFAHMLLIAKLTANGGFSTENTKPIEDIANRPPITFKKFIEDFKAMFA